MNTTFPIAFNPRDLAKRLLSIVLGTMFLAGATLADERPVASTVTVDLSGGKSVTFLPDEAFGRGIDALDHGGVERAYTSPNIIKINSSGLRRVSYRLRTELGIEAWHWGEEGTWSDPINQQGYWTSSDTPRHPVLLSNGYRLPRRGNTIDQANDDDFSRLDDGDPATFWKSNPYLDSYFTGQGGSSLPQWIAIELEEPRDIDAIRIAWAEPCATRFEVQYWDGPEDILAGLGDRESGGRWRPFPQGKVAGATCGDTLTRLSSAPISARLVRVLLIDSSHTALPGSTDVRDRLGFAVREIYLGAIDADGTFHDVIEHGAGRHEQTVIYTSSTDPWHRASDRDPDMEQVGFDRAFRSGMTNDLPVMMPVALLYDTPENAAAEMRFLKSRGYPVRQIEMGEEPDGQLVSPEHYGDLFLEFADAIHKVDPNLQLGAAGFQNGEVNTSPDDSGNTSWLNRFVKYLQHRRRLAEWGFFSFERYPFDDLCEPAADQIKTEPGQMERLFARLENDGVPKSIPWMITEYGYSAFAGKTMVEIPSALLNADMVAHFLMLGGKATYLFRSEPQKPMIERERCAGYGNMMLFEADDKGTAQWPMPIYYGAKLMTEEWAEPGNQPHRLYPVASNIRDVNANLLVNAYAVYRPDGKWSLMLINKDPATAYSVSTEFSANPGGANTGFDGTIDVFQYGTAQYHWVSSFGHGHPGRDDPPRHATQDGAEPVYLPPLSLTIVRGAGPLPR